MSNAYMIETNDEAAGIVVREGQRFCFLSSSPRFCSLDGQYYRSPKEAERAALATSLRAFATDDKKLDTCRFRLALVAAEVPERLFAELDRQLPAKGVVREERHTDRRDELAEHYRDAGFTRRGQKSLFGAKAQSPSTRVAI